MTINSLPPLKRLVLKAAFVYLGLLLLWFVAHLLLGDGFGYLGLINAVAVYLFAPLPLAMLAALWLRDWRLGAAGLLGAALFAWLWGPLLWPKVQVQPTGPVLRVMTFNILDREGNPDDLLASIRAEQPDVLFMQEVSPDLAGTLGSALQNELPFQVTEPHYSSNGLAVFSRYAIQNMDIVLGGQWQGTPQVLRLDWQGQQVTMVNFHALSTGGLWPPFVRYSTGERNRAAAALANFVAGETGPVIAAGDLNSTRLNTPFRLLTAVLQDAWEQAGQGLGHTFPAPVFPGQSVTQVSDFLIPHWIAGLDHIFYTGGFQASHAWLAQFHGGSDHRGVVAELFLDAH